MADNDTKQDNGFLQKVKESPRTISAIIIILIVAAAIYAFSDNPQPEVASEPTNEETQIAAENQNQETTQPESTEAPAVEPTTPATQAPESTPTPSGTVVTQEQISQQAQQLPESRKTDEGYEEVAQAGDGITHLARRATTHWLSENTAPYAITNEHRIYIEDYIQNRIGTNRLGVGDTYLISFSLIQEAVGQAQGLTSAQLHNLSQYTHVLP